MPLNLPRLQRGKRYIEEGAANEALRRAWQLLCENIEAEFGAVQAALDAQAAAAAAQVAADTATAAAATADASAAAAQTSADSAADVAALANSGVTGVTLTGTDAGASATINITAHTRVYGNGTNVAVNAGSVTGLAYSTLYYIYYDQPSRAGGAVTYQATTSEATAAQTGDRHLVGKTTTPAAAAPDTTGLYVGAPGIGSFF